MANLIRRSDNERLPPLAAWDPFALMRDVMRWDPFAPMSHASLPEVGPTPRFEVVETRDAFVLRADLPGIDESQLDITRTGNQLRISGAREAEHREEGDSWYVCERSYGQFARSFTLPDTADVDRVEANLKGGVLTVSVPKKSEDKPRRISLKGIADKVRDALGGKSKGEA